MKAVLISIHPNWCDCIFNLLGWDNGKPIYEKRIDLRKSKPTIELPFKAYIYCTKGKFDLTKCLRSNLHYDDSTIKISEGQGKVIGEFVCDRIIDIPYSECFVDYYHAITHDELKATCLDMRLIDEYLLSKNGYGWHISKLKIYDKPKELYEFYRKCEKLKCELCEHLKYQRVNSSEYDYDCEYVNGHIPITRAPQSWCYVEELNCE